MARSTNGTSDMIDAGALALLSGATLVTMVGWMARTGAGTKAGFGRYAENHRFTFAHLDDNVIYVVCENGGVAARSVSSSASGWHHYAAVYDGGGATNADRLKVYFDGVLQSPGDINTIPSSLSAVSNPAFRFGMDTSGGGSRFWTGSYAETALWDVALTAAEIDVLAKGYAPSFVRPAALKHYWPIYGRQSPEPDRRGSAAGTLTGTTYQDHPRLIQSAVPTVGAPAATGNTTLPATAPGITLTAPVASRTTTRTVVAGAPAVLLSAPAAALSLGGQILQAGAPAVTISAPAMTRTTIRTMLGGVPTVIFSAPSVFLSGGAEEDVNTGLSGNSGLSGLQTRGHQHPMWPWLGGGW